MSGNAALKNENTQSMDEKKERASAWFRTLRDQICAEFEKIEQEFGGDANNTSAGARVSPEHASLQNQEILQVKATSAQLPAPPLFAVEQSAAVAAPEILLLQPERPLAL